MKTVTVAGFLALLLGCSQPPPAPPAASTTPAASAPTPTPTRDFSSIHSEQVSDLSATPFTGMCVEFTSLVGSKLAAKPGAYLPVLDQNRPEEMILVFLPGADPAKVDSRPSQVLKLTGRLQPIEDAALVTQLEKKLAGKLHRREGKPVWLELAADPWPASEGKP